MSDSFIITRDCIVYVSDFPSCIQIQWRIYGANGGGQICVEGSIYLFIIFFPKTLIYEYTITKSKGIFDSITSNTAINSSYIGSPNRFSNRPTSCRKV